MDQFRWERFSDVITGGTEGDVQQGIYSLIRSLFWTLKEFGKREVFLEGSELTKDVWNLSYMMNVETSVKSKEKPFRILSSVQQYPAIHQVSSIPSTELLSFCQLATGLRELFTENLIESLSTTLLLTQSPFQKTNARGNGVAKNVGAQNEEVNVQDHSRLQDSALTSRDNKDVLMQAQESGAVLDVEQFDVSCGDRVTNVED
ncbi:hypothetical protein Tco_0803242 [Tanacetum coccineum]|uniref:Uncharacterized protein n=1 Tax=Tanacetum coccineum TaxID=301880 RepID=A0ABQ5A110_9ASTR